MIDQIELRWLCKYTYEKGMRYKTMKLQYRLIIDELTFSRWIDVPEIFEKETNESKTN